MLKLRVTVISIGFSNVVLARFQLRDEYCLITIFGDTAYVMDDNNGIQPIPLNSIKVLSTDDEDKAKYFTPGEYAKIMLEKKKKSDELKKKSEAEAEKKAEKDKKDAEKKVESDKKSGKKKTDDDKPPKEGDDDGPGPE